MAETGGVQPTTADARGWQLDAETACALKKLMRARADRFRRWSYWALIPIFVVLGGGAVVFYKAGDLVLKESTVSLSNLADSLDQIETETASLNKEADDLVQMGNKLLDVESLRGQQAGYEETLRTWNGALEEFEKDLERLVSLEWQGGSLPDEGVAMLTRLPAFMDQLGGDLSFENVLGSFVHLEEYVVDHEARDRIVESGRLAATRARQRIVQMQAHQNRLGIEIQAAEKLDLKQLTGAVRIGIDNLGEMVKDVDRYIEQVAAARADEGEETRMLAALGTRLVLLVILVFLVQILVNLYRYYVRLSSYYSARADLMRMAADMDAQTLSLVATTITADVDFQPPTSPNESLTEIIKSVATRGN